MSTSVLPQSHLCYSHQGVTAPSIVMDSIISSAVKKASTFFSSYISMMYRTRYNLHEFNTRSVYHKSGSSTILVKQSHHIGPACICSMITIINSEDGSIYPFFYIAESNESNSQDHGWKKFCTNSNLGKGASELIREWPLFFSNFDHVLNYIPKSRTRIEARNENCLISQ